MKRILHHILFPMILPVLFFIVASIPREAIGCRNRGLLAFAIALLSGIGAIGSVLVALKGRFRGDPYSFWWILTTLVLTIPVIALIILA